MNILPISFSNEDKSDEIHDAYFALLREAGEEFDVNIGDTPAKPIQPQPDQLRESSLP